MYLLCSSSVWSVKSFRIQKCVHSEVWHLSMGNMARLRKHGHKKEGGEIRCAKIWSTVTVTENNKTLAHLGQKLDTVAPLITDPPPTSSITLYVFFLNTYFHPLGPLGRDGDRVAQPWNKVRPYDQRSCKVFGILGKIKAKLYVVLVE